MNVTLKLKPEIEAQLVQQALAENLPLEVYLSDFLTKSLSKPNLQQIQIIDYAHWEQQFIRMTDEIADQSNPGFVDDSRESIYRERENGQL